MNSKLLFAFVLLIISRSDAQVCTGSLGDPIVNITFGSGQNPAPPISAAVTTYQYISTDCPNDGFYTVRNNSTACFSNTWHSIKDHTGNADGYFMLINASFQPGEFYLDTVRGLCGNTTYEFAAWILNILKPTSCGGNGSQPNLTFRIERTNGTLLQSYNTSNIPSTNNPEWKQYGFFFTTPNATTDVVLRIINNAQGGCGNDIGLDDITFRPCGPQIATSINGVNTTNAELCEGSSNNYLFNAPLSVGFNNPVVQWQQNYNGGAWTDIPGATTTSYSRSFATTTNAGSYGFRLSAAEAGNMGSAQCRINSVPLTVNVLPNPLPAATSNSPVCEWGTINLSATGGNATWAGPNGFTATGINALVQDVAAKYSGKYYVTTSNGVCTRTDSTVVVINAKPVVSLNKYDLKICNGDSAQLIATGAATYLWSPNNFISDTSERIVWLYPKDSSIYQVIGTSTEGCKDTASVRIDILAKPVANAGPDKTMMQGTTIQLNGSVKGDSISYYWAPGYHMADLQSLFPFITPDVDTSYILYVNSNVGCGIDTDTVKVHVFKKLLIPNAFSPNNDGINDVWMIGGIESYPNAEVTVFDRYGRPVFSTTNFKGWNGKMKGKPVLTGTYYYLINLKNSFSPIAGWLFMF